MALLWFMPQLAATDPVQPSTAIEKLRTAMVNDYSYRDLRGVNWDQRLDQFQERMTVAKTPKEFAELTAEYLKVAKDIHIWLKVDNQTIDVRPNSGGDELLARRVASLFVDKPTI